MPDDVVRLTVPPDGDLASVVVAALGALTRSAGFPAATVDHVRELAAEAYLRVLERGTGELVEIEAGARRPEWFFEMRRSDHTETHRSADGER